MQQSGGLLPAAGWTAAAPKCTESPRVHPKHRHPTGGPVFLSGEEIRTIQCSSPGDCCLPPAGRRQLQSVPNLLGSTRNTGIPPGDLFSYRERRFEPYNAAVRGTAAGWTAAAPKCTEFPRVHPKHRHPTEEMLPPDKNGGGKICFTGCLLL